MLLVQNNGLYACPSALEARTLDARVPLLMVIGEFARGISLLSSETRLRAVRMLAPTLDTWDVPYYRLEGPGDTGCIGAAYRRAQSERGPAAVIVGAPTC